MLDAEPKVVHPRVNDDIKGKELSVLTQWHQTKCSLGLGGITKKVIRLRWDNLNAH